MEPVPPVEEISILHPAALFGVFGFVVILGSAVMRLAPLAWQPIAAGGLSTLHWVLYGASIAFNFYAEGYRAFHKQVAPRVVARARALSSPRLKRYWVIAPLFCMSLVHATRKRLIITWSVYAGLVVLIASVRQLAQPWRGIVDAGVVVGLGFGVLSILYFFVRAVAGHTPPVSGDLPE